MRAALPGILVALPMEGRCLGGSAPRGTIEVLSGGARLLVAGVGPAAAEVGARALLAAGARGLVSLGLAGSLEGDVRAGELVLAERVLDCRGAEHPVDPPWRAALIARVEGTGAPPFAHHGGLLVESARAVISSEAKLALGAAHGARAVDMESGSVARVAREAAVPLLVVRAISDGSARRLPPAALCLDRDGRLQKGRFLRELARDPFQAAALLALHAELRAALKTLRSVWERAGSDLGFAER